MALGHLGAAIDVEESNGLQDLPSPKDQRLLNSRHRDVVAHDQGEILLGYRLGTELRCGANCGG